MVIADRYTFESNSCNLRMQSQAKQNKTPTKEILNIITIMTQVQHFIGAIKIFTVVALNTCTQQQQKALFGSARSLFAHAPRLNEIHLDWNRTDQTRTAN